MLGTCHDLSSGRRGGGRGRGEGGEREGEKGERGEGEEGGGKREGGRGEGGRRKEGRGKGEREGGKGEEATEIIWLSHNKIYLIPLKVPLYSNHWKLIGSKLSIVSTLYSVGDDQKIM